MNYLYSFVCCIVFTIFYAYHKKISYKEFVMNYTAAMLVQFIILKLTFDLSLVN